MSIPRSAAISLLLLLGIHSIVLSQNLTKNKTGAPANNKINTKASYVPGVLVVKLKPGYRALSNNLSALTKNRAVAEQLKKYSPQKFEKLIPQSQAPKEAFNRHKQPTTDLSLIHVLTLSADAPLQELIDLFMASGLVEYAEPQYVDQMLYIPSDTLAQPGQAQQLLFDRVSTYKAWDVAQGDTNVVIGVLDTGTEINHPDLAPNVKYNWADPIDGIDNDGDGYVDNFRGWDIGSNDNNPTWQVADHGVRVQGACSAMADNLYGTAGTGFKCKCLPIKISNSGGALTRGYEGIAYAMNHGVKVMNLSWGGYGAYSQASQDIINSAALDKDVLIVAAAGNTEGELDFYPASYDNVLSVSGLDTITSPIMDTLREIRKTFNFGNYGMSYSFKVDMASLEGGFTTAPGGTWSGFGGSSYASPTVAGAAGLVRAKYPNLSAIQAAEMLRVTGDILDTFDVTRPESRYKIGKKLNMYKALTTPVIPSVRMKNFKASSRFGTDYFSGDTITITQDFFNYLSKTNNLNIKMICLNGYATMLDDASYLGTIDSLTAKNNLSDPFKIIISSNAGINQSIDLVLLMSDPSTNYYDFQGFKIVVNPSYLKLDTSLVKTTITSNGRFGFNNYDGGVPSQGIGVNYKLGSTSFSMLYEGGLMIGVSGTKVSDCVRGDFGVVDFDFKSQKSVHYVYSNTKDMEAYSVFNDDTAASPIGIEVAQRSYAWHDTPDNKFFILEYQIINKSSNTYDTLAAGLFADWDVSTYQYNRADWNDDKKLAYTYSIEAPTPIAGIVVLTENNPSCYSLDNSNVGGNNINPNDGFSKAEKFQALASGVARKQAGATGFGNDVSQVVSDKVYNFAPGDTVTIAFAVIGGDNLFDLLDVAQQAKDKFVSIKQGPKPAVADITICRNDTIDVTLSPTTGHRFAFYSTLPPAAPDYVGSSYTLTNVSKADTLYIANVDSMFLSNLKTVYIKKDNMQLAFYPSRDTIQLAGDGTLIMVNQSTGATSSSWDFGDGNSASGNATVYSYNSEGYYKLSLAGQSPLSCKDTLTRVVKVSALTTGTEAILNGTSLSFYPNPVGDVLTLSFNGTMPSDLSLELINALGSQVYFAAAGTKNTSLDMSDLPSGIYYIKLSSGGQSVNRKIIKN